MSQKISTVNLDNYINLAYDYLYNNEKKKCYAVKPVTKTDILNSENIKIKVDDNDDNIISNILSKKTKIKQFGGNSVVIKRYSDKSHPSYVKISTYNSEDKLNNLYEKQNVDKVMKYLLSSHFEGNKHIIFPILNLDVSVKNRELEKYLKDNSEEFGNIIKDIKGGNAQENLSIEISEYFYKRTKLEDYLKNNINNISEEDLKTIIFQVVHTLGKIQDKFPGFRHNNLTINNIDIYQKKRNNGATNYKFNKHNFSIPNGEVDIKLNNFNSSNINNFYENKSLSNNLKSEDKNYDLSTFIKSLSEKFSNSKVINSKDYSNFNNRVIKSKLTPENILNKDIFFKSLKGGNLKDSESEYVTERNGNSAEKVVNEKEIEISQSNVNTVSTISEGGGLSEISTSESESDIFIKPNKNEIVDVRIINNRLDNVHMTYNLRADNELSGGSEDGSDIYISNRVLRTGLTDNSENSENFNSNKKTRMASLLNVSNNELEKKNMFSNNPSNQKLSRFNNLIIHWVE